MELINVKQVCEMLRLKSRTAIYRMMTDGEMPKGVKVGRSRRWVRDEIEAWVRAGCPRVED